MNISESFKKLKTPIVIIGLGKSGHSAETLLLKSGYDKSQVMTFDEKISADLGSWQEIEKLTPGTLVVSPGVPLKSDNIKKLIHFGWQLTSEINLAAQFLTDEVVVGITGSVGKSTVTSFLGAGFCADDSHAFVGGNLGIPFCDYAISMIDKKPKARFIVLELSSYQLENCEDLKLKYSAITYLSANHLERYSSLDEYYAVKCGIGKMTTDLCVINSASVDLVSFKNKIQCSVAETNITDHEIKLIGKHNLENYSVALELAKKCNLSNQAISAMKNFSGLAHRLENVGEFGGVLYINDSKATAMDSVLVATSAALEKIVSNGTLYLLLGGKDKNLPWELLHDLKHEKNTKILFFGQCAELAKNKSGLMGVVFEKLSQAIHYAQKNAKSGDVVLLSPGGTSLDEFKNFEERGNFFKKLVQQKINQ